MPALNINPLYAPPVQQPVFTPRRSALTPGTLPSWQYGAVTYRPPDASLTPGAYPTWAVNSYESTGILPQYSDTGQPTGQPGQTQTGTQTPDPNDPNSQFQVLNKVKNPDIATAETGLLKNVTDTAATTAKTFNDYLNEARQQNQQNQAQLATDRNTINAAVSSVPDYAATLKSIDTNFANTARGINTQYAGINADYAKTVAGDVNQLADLNKQYETSAQAVADRALQYAQGQTQRYQLGSGTPMSNSGDLEQRYLQAYQDINLPLQQQLAQMRQNQLTNYITPLQKDVYGNTVNQAVGFQYPMESALANRFTGTANTIENLRATILPQLAGKSLQESITYMQSLGIPIAVAQQVLSGDISGLSGVQGIDLANTFYGLTTPYTNNVGILPQYSPGGGGSRTYPVGGNAASYGVSAVVNPGAQPSSTPSTPGVINLPNNYQWGRTPDQQAYFAAQQNYYDTGAGAPPSPLNPRRYTYGPAGSGAGYVTNPDGSISYYAGGAPVSAGAYGSATDFGTPATAADYGSGD